MIAIGGLIGGRGSEDHRFTRMAVSDLSLFNPVLS